MRESKVILLIGDKNTGKTNFIQKKIIPACVNGNYFVIDPCNEYLSVLTEKKDTSNTLITDGKIDRLAKENDLLIIEHAFDKSIIESDLDIVGLLAFHRILNCSVVLVFHHFVNHDNQSEFTRTCSPKFIHVADDVLYFGSELKEDENYFNQMKIQFGNRCFKDMRDYSSTN